MGIAQRLWRQVLHPGDPRDPREIQGEIDDELAFHLEQRERELVAGGLAPQEARAEALRRFGDVEHIRAACRRVQTGGMIMLQRVTLALVVVLLGVVAWLARASVLAQRAARDEMHAMRANVERMTVELQKQRAQSLGFTPGLLDLQTRALQFPSTPHREEETAAAVWLERMRQPRDAASDEPDPYRWLITGCTPQRRGALLHELWPALDSAQRGALAQALLAAGVHSQMFEIAQLLVQAPEDALAAQGLEFLRKFALVDFRLEQRQDCLTWLERNRSRDLSEILAETAPALVARLKLAQHFDTDCERFAELSVRSAGGAVVYFDSAGALREAGGLDLIERWAAAPEPRARVAALNWMRGLELDDVTLRKLVVSMVRDATPRDPRFLPELCTLLAEQGDAWGAELLQRELELAIAASPRNLADVEALLLALAPGNREDVMPHALALMLQANSDDLTALFDRALLCELGGEQPDPRHDLEWWRNWWLVHRDEYPATLSDPTTGLPLVR